MDFVSIWNFVFRIISGIANIVSVIYNWLTTPVTIAKLEIDIYFTKITLFNGLTFVPINLILVAGGGILLTFLVFALIKKLPFA